MKLDRNQLAKDILLQHIDNLKSDSVCRVLSIMKNKSGETNTSILARISVEQADALIKELEK